MGRTCCACGGVNDGQQWARGAESSSQNYSAVFVNSEKGKRGGKTASSSGLGHAAQKLILFSVCTKVVTESRNLHRRIGNIFNQSFRTKSQRFQEAASRGHQEPIFHHSDTLPAIGSARLSACVLLLATTTRPTRENRRGRERHLSNDSRNTS